MPCVLVRLQIRVGGEPVEGLLQIRHTLERISERDGRSAERSLELPDAGYVGLQFLFCRAPRRVRRVDVREVPLVFIGNARAIALLCSDWHEQRHHSERNGNAADHKASFQGVLYNRSMQAPSTPTPSTPIIVKIIETNEIAGLGDTMLEAI